MSYGVFEHLAATDPEIRATRNASRAIVSARSRIERRFGTFIQKAASAEEREDRIRLVADDLLGVVHAACMEHDYARQEEIQSVLTKVLAHLRSAGAACRECGEPCERECANGICGLCTEKADDEDKKEAAAPLPVGEDKKCDWCGGKGSDGAGECNPCKGTGWTKKADSNNPSSYEGGTEAPDKDTSLDVSLDTGRPDFMDVGSKRHPSETQDVSKADDDALTADPIAASTNDAVSDKVNTDTPIGSEEAGPKTQTFDGSGQANPVTSKLRIV